jgi:hypothetical protein
MGDKQPELGAKSTLSRRLGVEIETFRGVNKEADPSAIRDDELQDGINIRIMPNGSIKNRDGLAKAFTTAMSDCATLIADDEFDNAGTLYYDTETSGGSFDFRSADKNDVATQPFTNALQVSQSNESKRWAIVFRGEIIAFASNKLYSMDFVSGTATLRATVGASASPDTTINSAAVVKGTAVDGGDRLYLAGDGTVWYWDGSGHEVIQDATTLGGSSGSGTNGAFVAYYAGDLVYCNTDIFRKRNGGSWTSVALPGTLTEWQPMDLVGYKNKLYIMGADRLGGGNTQSRILVYDNSSITIGNSPTNAGTGGGGPEGVSAGVSAFGYLYYAWLDPIDGNGVRYIGRYDGTTWLDTHKSLAAQFGMNGDNLYRLVLANGSIYANIRVLADDTNKIARSPRSSVSGTWVTVESGGDPGGPYWARDLVVLPRVL